MSSALSFEFGLVVAVKNTGPFRCPPALDAAVTRFHPAIGQEPPKPSVFRVLTSRHQQASNMDFHKDRPLRMAENGGAVTCVRGI